MKNSAGEPAMDRAAPGTASGELTKNHAVARRLVKSVVAATKTANCPSRRHRARGLPSSRNNPT
jgi:hypothetical protein